MPPVKHCLDPACTKKQKSAALKSGLYPRDLAEELSNNVVVFTQDLGPIPGISSSLYCRGVFMTFCQIHDISA